ncbi:MAG: hypothetical protein WCF69_04845 [Mycobacterium sp.]
MDDASGDPIGTFTADVANSSDILANTTQDLLVTSSSGDAPAVGSVYDYFFTGTAGSDSTYNVYSDVPSTTGGTDTITDSVVSPYGSFAIPIDFDAANGLADVLNGTSPLGMDIDLPNVYDITPDSSSPGTIVGIDGIQPEEIDVQGYQLFDYDPATGPGGTFDADVAQSAIIFGNSTQEQLVVASSSGDAPAAGSVFDVSNYGYGYKNIYSDIVSTTGGPNTITDTFVTPFGDFNVPDTYDAAAALASDSSQNFADPAAPAALSADLLNMLDPSALSSADPSAALDAGAFADLFPHLDAALNLLAGLF